MQRITIERFTDDRMGRLQWIFWYDERRHALVLDAYSEASRTSSRQKFREIENKVFSRTWMRRSKMKIDDVPLPKDVALEASCQFTDSLKVIKAQA